MQSRPYLIPGAIVIAGALIAIGFFFGEQPTLGSDEGNEREVAESPLSQNSLARLASREGVSEEELASCVENSEHEARVRGDFENAIDAGGQGTPFVVVINEKGQKFPFAGALPKAQVEVILDEARTGNLANNNSGTADSIRPVDEKDHIRGNANAPITIIEYSDYQCPFCGQLHPTLQSIVREHSDVRWVYRHFPLTSIHPQALPASIVSECVAQLAGNEAFWNFTDAIFEA